jgi:hypothetical protein
MISHLFKLFLFVIFVSPVLPQGTAGSKPPFESQYIVNNSTAGVIPKNSLLSNLNFMNNSSLELISIFGLFKDLNIGLGINIDNLVGSSSIDVPKFPGIMIKYRLFDETLYTPAVVLGLSSVGRGQIINKTRYFEVYPGAYLAFSKAFAHKIGVSSIHAGINYSFEPDPESRKVNYWFGFENSISNYASINIEYNPYLNDRKGIYAKKNDILNLGLRYSAGYGLTLELKLIDLLESNNKNLTRNFGIEFIRNL